MEVDSKPEEIDELDRELSNFKIEREALKKEEDHGSKERLENLVLELGKLENKAGSLTVQWQSEKTTSRQHRTLRNSWTKPASLWRRHFGRDNMRRRRTPILTGPQA